MNSYNAFSSPFLELETPFTTWEAIKMVLLLPTVPLRLCIALAAIVTLATINSIVTWGCDLEKPLSRMRRRLVEVNSQSCCRVVLFAMGFWHPKLIGHKHCVQGQEMGAVAVFNHVSYIDAFALVWAFCAAGLALTLYSKHLPILGWGTRALQPVYIHTQSDNKDKLQENTAQRIKERASDPKMPMLAVAAEGTCSNGRCLLQYKTGAFVAGRPVVPVLLRYQLKPHNPAFTYFIPLWHLLRLMCQFGNSLTIEVLPLHIPSTEEVEDPGLYAANTRKLMASSLEVPMVEQDRNHSMGVRNSGITVSWDGRRIVAPPGVVDEQGMCDLEPYMPATFKQALMKQQ